MTHHWIFAWVNNQQINAKPSKGQVSPKQFACVCEYNDVTARKQLLKGEDGQSDRDR